MQGYSTMRCLCAVISIMIVVATVTSAAPSYADYDNNIRDLWEMLLQKEAYENKLANHQIVRKSNRTPSLRLRFGRRSDPNMLPETAFMLAQDGLDHDN